jgi:hypothetical protein
MKPKRGEPYQGSYGKFLETLKTPTDKGAQSDAMDLLRLLADAGGRMAMKSLLDKVEMPTLQLVKAVEALQDQDLVTVTTAGDDDMCELTATGKTVVKLESSR